MSEKEIHIETAEGAMTTFVVHPDREERFPVALLFMDGIGYREQVKRNARRFAADGYYCVAPDLFYRSGTGLTFDMAKLAAADTRSTRTGAAGPFPASSCASMTVPTAWRLGLAFRSRISDCRRIASSKA